MATTNEGFSAAERAAMKQAAAERRQQAKLAKSAQRREVNLQAVLDAIAAMDSPDRELATRFHEIVTATVPELEAKTWYGMPAYASDSGILCFFQSAGKFGTRYATIGFQHDAKLDDGELWPVSFAIIAFTDEVATRVANLVRRACGVE